MTKAPQRVPASIRNKNPGAQQPGPSSRQFGSTTYQTLTWTGPDGKKKTNTIATFPTDVQGAAALFHLLATPNYADGKRTIREAITKWCGGYFVSTYLKVLYDQTGITADTILTRGLVCNPEVAIPLAKAMAWQEAGTEYPLDDDGWAQAHTLALPDAALSAVPAASVASAKPAADAEGWDRSARSSPETRIKEAAETSWTIKGGVLAFGTWVMEKAEASFGFIQSAFDTAQQVAGPKTVVGLVASAAKVSSTELIGCMTLGAIIIMISRRFSAAAEGKTG